jgi:hypothetical protein
MHSSHRVADAFNNGGSLTGPYEPTAFRRGSGSSADALGYAHG